MFRNLILGNLHRRDLRCRRLCVQALEDRRVLTIMADIIFLVDESGSGEANPAHEWLADAIPVLNSELNNAGILPGYGYVGFAQSGVSSLFAHSHLLDSELFGDATEAATAIDNLDPLGEKEDGWDAIEHAIAEYDFRDGAVPVFVLLQNTNGRIDLNQTLTREGVLTAMQSKNVLLNSIVDHSSTFASSLFSLSEYEQTAGDFSDIRILGVEADAADRRHDGQHDYHAFDTDTNTVVTSPPPD